MFVNPNRKYIIVGMTRDKKYKWTMSFSSFNREQAYDYCDELNKNSKDGMIYMVNSVVPTKREG